jgi:hypothetical protein
MSRAFLDLTDASLTLTSGQQPFGLRVSSYLRLMTSYSAMQHSRNSNADP